MADEVTTTEESETPDVASFTTVEEFDARIAELQATPTTANLIALTEVKAAKDAHVEAVAAAEAALAEPDPVEEPPVAETPPAGEPPVEPPVAETPDVEPAPVADPELLAASVAAGGGETPPVDNAPTTAQPDTAGRQQIRRASTDQAQTGWAGIADDYEQAFRDFSGPTTIWQAGRYSPDTPILKKGHSDMEAAVALGLVDMAPSMSPDRIADQVNRAQVNRAAVCPDSRFINDTPICLSLADELQQWIPKLAMDCAVKVRDPLTPATPTLFQWVYEEADPTDSDTIKTGLRNKTTGAITAYVSTDEATWKPLSVASVDCNYTEYKLRSEGYAREISRGYDLCNPVELERGLSMDTAYLEQAKATGIVSAFDASATAGSHVHTFDGVTGTLFTNPLSALAYFFGQVLPIKWRDNGVMASDYTLVMPSNLGGLLNVAKYESVADNNRYMAETIAEIAGVGDLVQTAGILATGSIDETPDAAIDPVADGRILTIPFYFARRASWRQGQGPGVRGSVSNDERNLRGNKRVVLVEDDLIDMPVDCLPVVKMTATVCFNGGHTLGTAAAACAGA